MYNKQNLIEAVLKENGGSRANAERIVEEIIKSIRTAVNDVQKINIAGLGIFSLKPIKAKMARNPKTGEAVKVAPHNKIKFTPAKSFKELVNGKKK